ncbi:MAG: hypothetical protein R3A52_25895 [Polyangiales bacterium]
MRARTAPRVGRSSLRSTGGGRRPSGEQRAQKSEVRAFARAFDALVRSARTHGHAIEPAAERARECWSALADAPLELAAHGLSVRGVPAVDLQDHEVRWLLPAFMAGLRSLAPRPGMTLDELRALADELARLESEVTAIARFRDWLWANGTAGFDIEVQTSFMEVFDDYVLDPSVDGALVAMQASELKSLTDRSVMLSAQDLDGAAEREEFDVPLSMAPPSAGDERFAMRPTAAAPLRAACDDEARWRLHETALLLSHRPLHDTLQPLAFARRVIDVLTRDPAGAGVELLDLLTSQARRSDPFARALVSALDGDVFADAVAASAMRAPGNTRTLAEVMLVAGPATTERLVALLLDHAEADPGWADALAHLASAMSGRLEELLMHGDPTAHTAARLRALGPAGVRWMASQLGSDVRWTPKALGALCDAAVASGLALELLVPFVRDRHKPLTTRLRLLDAMEGRADLVARCVAWRPGELLDALEARERFRALRDAKGAKGG